MNISQERLKAAEDLVRAVKSLPDASSPDRATVESILALLKRVAARTELWSAADFPEPEDGERQARYLIREDTDRSFALYLNVMRRGKRTPIHNHTTWACIAAVEGAEHNFLYERRDDRTRPGYAEVVETGVKVVRPGEGVALMPEDIHAVQIIDDAVIRHLHFYGRALETLSERLAFDPEARTCRIMDIGVTTRRLR